LSERLRSVDEQQRIVLDGLSTLESIELTLLDAQGLLLAENVYADVPLPGFDNSAMDGYAVRAIDTVGSTREQPTVLPVVGDVAAGARSRSGMGPGLAMRIMTGAPLPAGADAVVLVERSIVVPADAGAVDLTLEVQPGTSVRAAGGDVSPGDVVLGAGILIGPAHLGVLASVGLADVDVIPRPRVGVISTGDELVSPGQPLGPGQIHDSNRLMLLALVAEAGATAVDLGCVPDDEPLLERTLRAAVATCDVIVTSGGVSMGDADVVKLVLGRIAEMEWMQIAIRPAKPFALGVLDGTPIIGLPGNPVSSLVSFELLARPGLRARAGRADLDRPRLTATTRVDVRRTPDGKTHLLRVNLHAGPGGLEAEPVSVQGSHQLAASAGADALAVVPDGPGLAAGDEVEVILLKDAPPA
jgi:molybdenum cofactor synthesis domain-containing protein